MRMKILSAAGLLAFLAGACASAGSASQVLQVCGGTETPACENEEQLQITASRDACFEVFTGEAGSETKDFFTSVIPSGLSSVENGATDYQGITWEVVEDNMVLLTLEREGQDYTVYNRAPVDSPRDFRCDL